VSDDLRDLYQEVILDHGRHPRNKHVLADANHLAHGENPLCGDKLIVYVRLTAEKIIEEVSFEGQGCAISTASASLMTEVMVGKSLDQAEKLFGSFHALATGEGEAETEGFEDDMDRLEVLSGVRDYPVRVKCATLAWHTLSAALNDQREVSTE
jgi:nitrogen fixation NifU-like protein